MSDTIAKYSHYDLNFNVPGKTSRGTMLNRRIWLLEVSKGGLTGIGECAPLDGLSIDNSPEKMLDDVCKRITIGAELPDLSRFPSVQFAVETALKDLSNGGKRLLFNSDFISGKMEIPINGLIWMGNADYILKQVEEKIRAGFTCLKFKIGGLDFDEELAILEKVRKNYGYNGLEIRLDANGAFSPKTAMQHLQLLSEFRIHSIEQPVMPGNTEAMQQIIKESPIPIALDEELIGIQEESRKNELLSLLKPDYIILKPSLIGGFSGTGEWIRLAEKHHTGWWITSALESNIGLNAIAQWTATLDTDLSQGLGTGQVFSNNFSSPLSLGRGVLRYNPGIGWGEK